MPVAQFAMLFASLAQSGVNIAVAIKTLGELHAKPEPTAEDFAAFEVAMIAALDQSKLVHATMAAARAVALAGAKAQQA